MSLISAPPRLRGRLPRSVRGAAGGSDEPEPPASQLPRAAAEWAAAPRTAESGSASVQLLSIEQQHSVDLFTGAPQWDGRSFFEESLRRAGKVCPLRLRHARILPAA